jgi:hypothetical protein
MIHHVYENDGHELQVAKLEVSIKYRFQFQDSNIVILHYPAPAYA